MFSYIFTKTMGSKWSVAFLAIVTLYFATQTRAQDLVSQETLNVSVNCPSLDKNHQEFPDLLLVHSYGYSLDQTASANSTYSGCLDLNSTSDFTYSFLVIGIVVIVMILSYASYSLKQAKLVVRLLKEKVVDLTCNLGEMTTDYGNLLDEYETTKAALEEAHLKIVALEEAQLKIAALQEAQLKIATLEQELQVKSQAVSEVEGLLNETMTAATEEAGNIQREGEKLRIKYKDLKYQLSASYLESSKIHKEAEEWAESNAKLEMIIIQLEEEVIEYRELHPLEGKRGRTLEKVSESENQRISRKQGALWRTGFLTCPHPDFPEAWQKDRSLEADKFFEVGKSLVEDKFVEQVEPLEDSEASSLRQGPESLLAVLDSPIPKKKANFFKRTWRKVFSRKAKKSVSKTKTAKDSDGTLPSNIRDRVDPEPP